MDARAQPGRADADGGGDEQRAGRDVLALGHLGFDLLQFPVHAVRGAEQLLADFGEDEAAGVADEELEAEIVLERGNLPGDGRLAHVQLFGGVGEASRTQRQCGRCEACPNRASTIPPLRRVRWSARYSLGIERGHAAHAGGGDGLAVDVVGDVAGGEDAGNVGGGAARD